MKELDALMRIGRDTTDSLASSISVMADLYTRAASKPEKAAADAFDRHLAPHLHGCP